MSGVGSELINDATSFKSRRRQSLMPYLLYGRLLGLGERIQDLSLWLTIVDAPVLYLYIVRREYLNAR